MHYLTKPIESNSFWAVHNKITNLFHGSVMICILIILFLSNIPQLKRKLIINDLDMIDWFQMFVSNFCML